jgi:hypothetical protein
MKDHKLGERGEDRSNIPTNKTPLAMKIGRRPLISEKGARIIGARAKPTQKRVMLRL